MDKKIIGGVIAGIGAAIGGAAVFFNKRRHADDFVESDINDETEVIDDEVEDTDK